MDTKKLIIQKSIDLFSNKGYSGVGIKEIVDACNVTKPTLYHHFGSKMGLFKTICDILFKDWQEHLGTSLVYEDDIVLTLNRLCERLFDFALLNPEFSRIMLNTYFTSAELEENRYVTQGIAKVFKKIEEIFKKAALHHGNMQGRSFMYAAGFLATIHTYIGFHVNGSIDLRDISSQNVMHQFMHGIFS